MKCGILKLEHLQDILGKDAAVIFVHAGYQRGSTPALVASKDLPEGPWLAGVSRSSGRARVAPFFRIRSEVRTPGGYDGSWADRPEID